jgi:Alkylmercury lyase
MTNPKAAFPARPAWSAGGRLGRTAPVDRTAVDMCCSYLNFHADRASAEAWAAAHPRIRGTILDRSSALALGQATFGHILTAPA